ncbi:hypothetical protein [Pelagibacterium xiamenense]|uniref:hypothetical protein n=1 Tax=Pelagibacterium xiamenense TaxID=2901140 RepID=UPI001E452407|nr:hypothetical protein [Pelagibacterium xiamenense]MCD7059316.1 hypothetical protein [Pelagibacterium xiamenense]
MSTVVERLVESWLDNQTERRYQAAFVQMLISLGWSVLHSTRHSALEFGKDVVARNPEGTLYAFQLKGNPGSRLTKTEAQGLVPQIEELNKVPLPSNIRGGRERHHAVLVTNGEIDEEAQSLFALMAADVGETTAAISFKWWGRGELLALFLSTARQVWPTSPKGTRTLLNLMATDGRDLPDLAAFTEVLVETAPVETGKASASLLNSRVSSTLLISEIAKAKWYEEDNHYALYQLTIIATIYASRFVRGNKRRKAIVRGYVRLVESHAQDLMQEAQDAFFEPTTTWTGGDPLSEVDIMWHRRNLVAECAAFLLLSKPDEDSGYDRAYAREMVSASLAEPNLWGEGAIPSLIMRYWSVYKWGGISAELGLADILRQLMSVSRGRVQNTIPLASPYYDFSSCWARSQGAFWLADPRILEDSFDERMWMARTLLLMLAKRNMKVTCKQLWQDFSHILHESMSIAPSHFRDCLLSGEGELISRTYYALNWQDLLQEVRGLEAECDHLSDFEDAPWIVAAYVSIVPYRAWEPVMMWLDRQLCSTWH